MSKKYLTIAFAYTGIIVGAGLSSGQDLLQYFLSFGIPGLFGVAALALLNILFGRIIVTLGCYYQADNHEQVLSRVAHPLTGHIIDLALVAGSYVMGFVMVAGAGANLHQQFGLPVWTGALLCTALVILVSFLDFDRITAALGCFTPIAIVIILIVCLSTYAGGSFDFAALGESAKSIAPAMSSLPLSVLNYFSLCLITGVGMAFVLGGSLVRIGTAERGGALGGAMVGLIIVAASLALFAHLDDPAVRDSAVPMLMIVQRLSPALALVYAVVIFGLIFNTAFSLYFSIARRFSGGNLRRQRVLMIAIAGTGFACSFGGFRELIGLLYPAMGYLGMVLIVVLFAAWIREHRNILREKALRRAMIRLQLRRYDEALPCTEEDEAAFAELSEYTAASAHELRSRITELAADIGGSTRDLSSFVRRYLHLPFSCTELLQKLSADRAEADPEEDLPIPPADGAEA